LGASPQTPRVGFAEFWVWKSLLRSRTNAFCFFFWKKKTFISSIGHLMIVEQYFSWGQAPKPPGSASPSLGYLNLFCGVEQTLFASFSGKRRISLVRLAFIWLFDFQKASTQASPSYKYSFQPNRICFYFSTGKEE
jgi:hypothetical protein